MKGDAEDIRDMMNKDFYVTPGLPKEVKDAVAKEWKGRCVSELEEGDAIIIMSKTDYDNKGYICKEIEHQRDGMIDVLNSSHDVIVGALRQVIGLSEELRKKALETLGLIALALED